MKFRARRAGNTMRRPQDLLTVGHHCCLERHLAFVRCVKGFVANRMPILTDNHIVELGHKAVDRRNNCISVLHSQGTARAKVFLHINDDQNIRFAQFDLLGHV